jgi:hypothetical protein
MEKSATQKEILLMTGTSFTARNYADRNDSGKASPLTEIEKLEEACWNGLLKEMLPEVFEKADNKLYLWQIREADSFIELELAEAPTAKNSQFSLDPYSFLSTTSFN